MEVEEREPEISRIFRPAPQPAAKFYTYYTERMAAHYGVRWMDALTGWVCQKARKQKVENTIRMKKKMMYQASILPSY